MRESFGRSEEAGERERLGKLERVRDGNAQDRAEAAEDEVRAVQASDAQGGGRQGRQDRQVQKDDRRAREEEPGAEHVRRGQARRPRPLHSQQVRRNCRAAERRVECRRESRKNAGEKGVAATQSTSRN